MNVIMFYVIFLSMEDRDRGRKVEILLVTEQQNRKPEMQFEFILFSFCNVPGKQIRLDRNISAKTHTQKHIIFGPSDSMTIDKPDR
jgi:hypothetical protein